MERISTRLTIIWIRRLISLRAAAIASAPVSRERGRMIRLFAALCAAVVWAESCHADCSSLHVLAQQHANDMARRNSLDHAGFMRYRGPAGAVAENVAVGCETEECARRVWMQSPPHRANMMHGGCQAVASAVSASGRRYWVMEIGGSGSGGAGRDFSIEGSNALSVRRDRTVVLSPLADIPNEM